MNGDELDLATITKAELKSVITALVKDEVLLAELLVAVAVEGKSEEARVQAGIAVLSRVGLGNGVRFDGPLLAQGRPVEDEGKSPGQIVHERLARLRAEGRGAGLS